MDTYKLDITGKSVQNVGLRKELHRILDKDKMHGVAINDPIKNTVDAYVSGSKKKRLSAYGQLETYIKDKTGNPIHIKETKQKSGLKSVFVSKKQMNTTANNLYLTYMMRNPDVNRVKISGLNHAKSERDMMPRFRLKKVKGGYTGKLTDYGAKQIKNEAPHYAKFRKGQLKTTQEEALSRIHPKDRKILMTLAQRNKIQIHD